MEAQILRALPLQIIVQEFHLFHQPQTNFQLVDGWVSGQGNFDVVLFVDFAFKCAYSYSYLQKMFIG